MDNLGEQKTRTKQPQMEDGNSALSFAVEKTSITLNVGIRSRLFGGYKGRKLYITTT